MKEATRYSMLGPILTRLVFLPLRLVGGELPAGWETSWITAWLSGAEAEGHCVTGQRTPGTEPGTWKNDKESSGGSHDDTCVSARTLTRLDWCVRSLVHPPTHSFTAPWILARKSRWGLITDFLFLISVFFLFLLFYISCDGFRCITKKNETTIPQLHTDLPSAMHRYHPEIILSWKGGCISAIQLKRLIWHINQ